MLFVCKQGPRISSLWFERTYVLTSYHKPCTQLLFCQPHCRGERDAAELRLEPSGSHLPWAVIRELSSQWWALAVWWAKCWSDVLDILSKIIKMKFYQFFTFLSTAFRKYKIMYVACVIFLLGSDELEGWLTWKYPYENHRNDVSDLSSRLSVCGKCAYVLERAGIESDVWTWCGPMKGSGCSCLRIRSLRNSRHILKELSQAHTCSMLMALTSTARPSDFLSFQWAHSLKTQCLPLASDYEQGVRGWDLHHKF